MRMTRRQEYNRAFMENALAEIAGVLVLLDLVELRIGQAVRRSRLGDLLTPAVMLVRQVRERLTALRDALAMLDADWREKDNYW